MVDINKLINEIYVAMYDEAVFVDGKKYDWPTVKENAVSVNGDKLKYVPFMSFYFTKETQEAVVGKILRGKHTNTRHRVEPTIYLGPSPTTGDVHWNDIKSKFEKYIAELGDEIRTPDEIGKAIGESPNSDIVIAIAWYKKVKESTRK